MTICQSMSNDEVVIDSQTALDVELSRFPWHDSFVREAHVLSPTYIIATTQQVVASNSPWVFRLLVCSSDSQHPGLEFIFEEADQIVLSNMIDLQPYGVVGVDEIILFLSTLDQIPIRAKRLRIRRPGTNIWGLSPRYSNENMFDEGGYPC